MTNIHRQPKPAPGDKKPKAPTLAECRRLATKIYGSSNVDIASTTIYRANGWEPMSIACVTDRRSASRVVMIEAPRRGLVIRALHAALTAIAWNQ